MTEIEDRWAERDRRYTFPIRGFPRRLTPTEIAIVRAWRMVEARDLPARRRSLALLALRDWTSPARDGSRP